MPMLLWERASECGMFDLLPVNLTSLNLELNQLTYLQAGSIRSISQLRHLRLSNNQIRKVDPESFRGATNLSVSLKRDICIDKNFEISNDLDLNTTIAMLLKTCYNSGQKSDVAAVVLAFSVFFSFAKKFL